MLKTCPKINKRFVDFYHEVFKDDHLTLKTKELIALAVSLGAGCRPCYDAHLKKAKEQGISDEEIREAVAVTEVVASGKIRMMVQETQDRAEE